MDVSARISQIQSQIAYLSGGAAVRSGASAGAASGAAGSSATAFADALGAATGTSSASATSSTAGSSGSTGSGAGGSVTGEDVVAQARRYLGVPYVWGGTDPAKGLDCSGLVQRVYDNLGIDLPRVSHQQARAGHAVEGGLANARPGDILAFNSPVNHVGIYIGDGKMIEAPRTGLDVRVIDVYETPTAIRRVLPEPGAAGATSATSALGGAAAQRRVADVPFASLFNEVGARYGVDPTLLASIARQESAFDPRAVSPAGAQGLMQLMPATARGLGVANPYDPAQAVDGAGRLVRDLLTRFDRVDLALAAYNAGPGAVIRHGGVPPYAETQGYVRNVMQSWSAAR